jgi:hypothetical protein
MNFGDFEKFLGLHEPKMTVVQCRGLVGRAIFSARN